MKYSQTSKKSKISQDFCLTLNQCLQHALRQVSKTVDLLCKFEMVGQKPLNKIYKSLVKRRLD